MQCRTATTDMLRNRSCDQDCEQDQDMVRNMTRDQIRLDSESGPAGENQGSRIKRRWADAPEPFLRPGL